MRIAYFDCFAGLSGEMLLGALLGAGLSFDALRSTLSQMDLPGHTLDIQNVVRKELPGVRLHLSEPLTARTTALAHSRPNAGHKPLTPARIINNSVLPDLIKQTALAIFRKLAQAETAVYGNRAEEYTGSESQKLESLVAVVGVVSGLSLLGISRVECSPLHVGSGVTHSAAGIFPALSPVTAEILRAASVPVYGSHVAGELVTPLGAAIITTLASAYGPIPAIKIRSVGYGAGRDDLPETSNLVRLFIGEQMGGLQTVPNLPRIEGASTPVPTRPHKYQRATPPPTPTEQPPAVTIPAPTSAPTPAETSPYVSTHDEWLPLAIRGHQQSGRQRLAS